MRKVVFALSFILLTLPSLAAAQGPPPQVQIVASVLELSEAQIVALLETIQAREAAVQPLQQQLQSQQQALGALLESESPDPAEVGLALLAVRNTQKQIEAVVRQTTAQFEQSLAEEQRTRLQQIREASQVCRILPAFQALGLI